MKEKKKTGEEVNRDSKELGASCSEATLTHLSNHSQRLAEIPCPGCRSTASLVMQQNVHETWKYGR